MAKELLKVIHDNGFEGKIKLSFGDSCKAGMGMLDSKDTDRERLGNTSIQHFHKALKLLGEAK